MVHSMEVLVHAMEIILHGMEVLSNVAPSSTCPYSRSVQLVAMSDNM